MKKLFIYIMLIFVIVACSKDNDEVKTTGDIVLSSQIMGNETNYYVEGFLFDKAKKVSFNITSSTIPDLVLENSIDLSGNVIGANLISPQNDAAFYKAGEFATLSEAETFFNNITDAGTNDYTITAENIKANQVYVFQSRGDKYAKLLIKDFTIIQIPLTDYAKVTIQWVYQPSGEKTFVTAQ